MSVRQLLLNKINNNIKNIQHIEVQDMTHKHASHLPENTHETHFNITIVSDEFCYMPLMQRHRMIYKILDFELTHKIHALSLLLFTTIEYKNEKEHANNKRRVQK